MIHFKSREVDLRRYETLLIIRPDLDEENLKSLIEEIKSIISRQGGRVTSVDNWGVRRLEYPIKREEKGRYAVVNFEGEGSAVKELERVMKIKDEVLRTKTILVEGE